MAEGLAKVGKDTRAPTPVNSSNSLADSNRVETLQGPAGEPDPAPKWRAMFFLIACKQRLPVLGDSGCTGSCISTEFLEKNPSLRKTFKPKESTGVAINGSDVRSEGTVRLDFTVGNYPMSIKCKVIKDLMDPIILGWDWMSKYGVSMDAGEGVVRFGKDRTTPLIEHERPPEGAYYRVTEDLTLPPLSKIHTQVELATSWNQA